jgi:hypothetical protein
VLNKIALVEISAEDLLLSQRESCDRSDRRIE